MSNRHDVAPIGPVFGAMRDLHREGSYPDGVPVALIRERVLESHRIRYDTVNRALTELVETGMVAKPKRGHYAPLHYRAGRWA